MAKILEGNFDGKGKRIGIAASRFNDFIVARLVEGAIGTLVRHGVKDDDITVAWAPGAFELPTIAGRMADSKHYDAVIVLGCVIRGATPHFDYVAGEAAKGVGQIAMNSAIPVLFGVLTTESIEQAIERAGTKAGNKGADAAMGALEMMNLLEKL